MALHYNLSQGLGNNLKLLESFLLALYLVVHDTQTVPAINLALVAVSLYVTY
jgi:hypothetical protein